jgi:hypothetical protein
MKITLQVKSSNGIDVYDVIFKNRNDIISIKCKCRAGELTKLCRHKISLVRGDPSILFNKETVDDYKIVQQWLKNSQLSELIIKHDFAEKEFLEKQKEFKKIKAIIEDAMRRGI